MKFTFRTVSILCLILSSSSTLAWDYDNFYVGANIGPASLMDKERTNTPINDSHDLSALGIIGGGLVGVNFTLQNQLKLGIEGFANAASIQISANQNYAPLSSYTVNMRNNFGLRLIPGVEFMPGTIAHLILGYSSAKFTINDNGNYGLVNSQFRLNGFQYGMGMITDLVHNLSLRTDILYSTYGTQSSSGTTTTIPAATQNYHNTLTTLEGNLMLVYKFC